MTGKSTTDALLKYKSTLENSKAKYVLTLFVNIHYASDNVWWPATTNTEDFPKPEYLDKKLPYRPRGSIRAKKKHLQKEKNKRVPLEICF